MLDRKSVKVVKAEEREARVDMEDMKKEKEGCLSMGASAGGPTIFMPRSFQPDVAVPTLNSFPRKTRRHVQHARFYARLSPLP